MIKQFFFTFTAYAAFLLLIDSTFLTLPPFFDSVLAVFKEAFWLLDHDWNYNDLLFTEPGYAHGGARTYIVSVYPSLVALVYASSSTTSQAIITLHLLTLCVSSFCLLFIYNLSLSLTQSRALAFGNALLLGVSPLFVSQSLGMNMEIPLAFCVLGTAYSLVKKQWGRALIFSLAAYAVKPTGCLVGGALCIAVFHERKKITTYQYVCSLFFSILPTILALWQSYLEYNVFYKGGADGRICSSLFSDPVGLLANFFYLSFDPCIATSVKVSMPILTFVIYLLTLLFISYYFAFGRLKYSVVYRSLCTLIRNNSSPCVVFMFAYCACTYFFFNIFSITLPRYLVNAIVVLIPLTSLLVMHVVRNMLWRYVLIAGFFIYSILIDFSVPPIARQDSASDHVTIAEWSPKYSSIIQRDKVFFSTLAKRTQKTEIVITTWPYNYMAQDPRYGYVSTPLPALSLFRKPVPTSFCRRPNKGREKIFAILDPMMVFTRPYYLYFIGAVEYTAKAQRWIKTPIHLRSLIVRVSAGGRMHLIAPKGRRLSSLIAERHLTKLINEGC
jgi:hypothetical protein